MTDATSEAHFDAIFDSIIKFDPEGVGITASAMLRVLYPTPANKAAKDDGMDEVRHSIEAVTNAEKGKRPDPTAYEKYLHASINVVRDGKHIERVQRFRQGLMIFAVRPAPAPSAPRKAPRY